MKTLAKFQASFKKMPLKMSSAKCQQFYLALSVLNGHFAWITTTSRYVVTWDCHYKNYSDVIYMHGVSNLQLTDHLFSSLSRLTQVTMKAPRVAGPLWGEFNGDRWIPITKGQYWNAFPCHVVMVIQFLHTVDAIWRNVFGQSVWTTIQPLFGHDSDKVLVIYTLFTYLFGRLLSSH